MSASYVLAFARVANQKKAETIIDKYGLETKSAFDISQEEVDGGIGCDWADVELCGIGNVLKRHPNSKYLLLEDYNEAYCNDLYAPKYDYDFSISPILEELTRQNGFADVKVGIGAGCG